MENTLCNSYIEYLVEDKYHKLNRWSYRITNTNPEDILKIFKSNDTLTAQHHMISSWGYSTNDYYLIAFRLIEDINVSDEEYYNIPYVYFGNRVAEYELPAGEIYMMRTQSDYYANVNIGINAGINCEYYPMRQNDMTYEEYVASVEKEKNGISK